MTESTPSLNAPGLPIGDDMQTIAVAKPVAAAPAEVAVMGANPDSPVPFVFGKRIAKGGMGAILEGEDCKLGRTIAVKVMLDANASDDQARRFVQEAAVLGKLAHPNIVPVYDLGRDSEGALYYTMKLVKGRTLQDILDDLRREKKEALEHYTLDRLLTIFRKVCDALAFAHASNIIHRDLKPENVMVGEFGEVLVMDWGIAKVLNELGIEEPMAAVTPQSMSGTSSFTATMDGAVMGTPNYMSPEQAMGKVNELDERSDIFSLGGILYAILTLRPPVEGKDVWEVLEKVQMANITAPTVFGASTTGKASAKAKSDVLEAKKITPLPHMPGGRVPNALSAVVMKALTLDKAKRYQNVAAFSADIEKFQGGFATSAEDAGAWKQFTLLVQRHKAASIGVAAVLFIGGTLGTKAIIEGRRAERALAELKKSAPAFAAEADSLMLKGDVEGAARRLKTATELDPRNPRWHGRQGQVLDATLRVPEAAATYARAAALDPKGPWSAARQTSEKLAAARQPDGSYPTPLLQELYALALREGRTGDALHLSTPLQKTAKETLPLWQAKVDAWLGKNGPKLKVEADGGLSLNLERLGLTDLSPLKGMPLGALGLAYNKISDLSPLAGMPLKGIWMHSDLVRDLTPLTGMRLTRIAFSYSQITDLSPLRGMPLEEFRGNVKDLTDISPLRDAPLRMVWIDGASVADLSPLAGKQLETLEVSNCPIKDFSILRGMPLKNAALFCGPNAELVEIVMNLPRLEFLSIDSGCANFERLRTHPSLKYLWGGRDKGHIPVAQFWAEWDARKAKQKK